MITLEQIDRVLAEAQLKVTPAPRGSEKFDRCRDFAVGGVAFRIEWWRNVGYLSAGPLTLPFDVVCIDAHSPLTLPFDVVCIDAHSPRRSASDMDLRFYYRGEQFGPVINLVDWVKP